MPSGEGGSWGSATTSDFSAARNGGNLPLQVHVTSPSAIGERGSEAKLMIRVADDDPSARQDLAVRVRPRVQRTARALLRHDADADDATQASILEILRAAASFRGESSLTAWADRIAVRTIMRV